MQLLKSMFDSLTTDPLEFFLDPPEAALRQTFKETLERYPVKPFGSLPWLGVSMTEEEKDLMGDITTAPSSGDWMNLIRSHSSSNDHYLQDPIHRRLAQDLRTFQSMSSEDRNFEGAQIDFQDTRLISGLYSRKQQYNRLQNALNGEIPALNQLEMDLAEYGSVQGVLDNKRDAYDKIFRNKTWTSGDLQGIFSNPEAAAYYTQATKNLDNFKEIKDLYDSENAYRDVHPSIVLSGGNDGDPDKSPWWKDQLGGVENVIIIVLVFLSLLTIKQILK